MFPFRVPSLPHLVTWQPSRHNLLWEPSLIQTQHLSRLFCCPCSLCGDQESSCVCLWGAFTSAPTRAASLQPTLSTQRLQQALGRKSLPLLSCVPDYSSRLQLIVLLPRSPTRCPVAARAEPGLSPAPPPAATRRTARPQVAGTQVAGPQAGPPHMAVTVLPGAHSALLRFVFCFWCWNKISPSACSPACAAELE